MIAESNDALSLAETAQTKAQAMLNGKVHDLYGQRDDLVQYMLLSQEYDSNRRMYESIVARLREAAVDAGLDAADINIVDLAAVPDRAFEHVSDEAGVDRPAAGQLQRDDAGPVPGKDRYAAAGRA